MRIETHVHTRYSKDSVQCFWPLYQKFCCKRGSKLQVIVGEEIFTDSGEIIGLF